MAVGKTVTRADADQSIGIMVQTLFHSQLIADQVTDWFNGVTAPELEALYPDAAERTLVTNIMADASQLLRIFRGQDPLAVAKNFRTNAKKALGTGLY